MLVEGARPARRAALVELDEDRHGAFDIVQMRALVTNEYKLVYYAPTGEVMLFDRKNDPEEMKSLAKNPEYRSVVGDMVRQLLYELSRTDSRRPRQVCGA